MATINYRQEKQMHLPPKHGDNVTKTKMSISIFLNCTKLTAMRTFLQVSIHFLFYAIILRVFYHFRLIYNYRHDVEVDARNVYCCYVSEVLTEHLQ